MTVPLVFVGDFPSEEDAEIKLPLVDSAGRILGTILRMAGLGRTDTAPKDFYPDLTTRRRGLRPMLWERSDFAITNVFDWTPPNEDISALCLSSKAARDAGMADDGYYLSGAGYLRREHRSALDRLSAEIALADPAVIVPLGPTALWAFTGSGAITESRGVVMRAARLAPNTKLVPTLHPRHVMQDWRMLTVVVGDVMRAAREASNRDHILHRGARELWIEPTLADLDLWWRERGSKSGLLSADIETPRGQISCVGIGADAVSAICVPFVDWRQPNRSYWSSIEQELKAWEWLDRVLGCETPKVLQNGTFDVFWLLMEMGVRLRNYRHDTRLMHHALYPEQPKSLAFMGSCYASPPGPWKTMRGGLEKRDA